MRKLIILYLKLIKKSSYIKGTTGRVNLAGKFKSRMSVMFRSPKECNMLDWHIIECKTELLLHAEQMEILKAVAENIRKASNRAARV